MKYCSNCGTQIPDDAAVCPQCLHEINNQLSPAPGQAIALKNAFEKITPLVSTNNPNKAYMCPVIFGIVLILIGLFIQVPGGALTTYGSLDGIKAEYYVFDDKYSSIDEYVGGDAYNYIIGASLVAGKISGTMTAKAIIIVGGVLCLCFGITLFMLQKNKVTNATHPNGTNEESI